MKETIPGVNIQWPWSEYLLSGEKTVETRSYPLSKKHEGKWLAVIETPGPKGKKLAGIDKARITGKIKFKSSFRYSSKSEWLNDYERHRVKPDDKLFGYKEDKEKWGWLVEEYVSFESFQDAPLKRGIIFASACEIN